MSIFNNIKKRNIDLIKAKVDAGMATEADKKLLQKWKQKNEN
tara:strand:+ start:356 stop:481 length:126 start_codon:yes stop_codon:yes gene_type:complete